MLPHERKHYASLSGAGALGEPPRKSETFSTELLFKSWKINRGRLPDILGAAVILRTAWLMERSKASLTRIRCAFGISELGGLGWGGS